METPGIVFFTQKWDADLDYYERLWSSGCPCIPLSFIANYRYKIIPFLISNGILKTNEVAKLLCQYCYDPSRMEDACKTLYTVIACEDFNMFEKDDQGRTLYEQVKNNRPFRYRFTEILKDYEKKICIHENITSSIKNNNH